MGGAERSARRRALPPGFLVLTAASPVAGLAPDATTLLIAGGVQGAGAALIAPAAVALVMRLFGGQPTELRKALGFWGAAAAAGGTAGVFLGGVIPAFLSWEWTFPINVPLGGPPFNNEIRPPNPASQPRLPEGRARLANPAG